MRPGQGGSGPAQAPGGRSHAHFMCKRCGKLFDVALPESLKDFLPKGSDFKVDEAHVYYKGVCKACAMEA